MTIPPIFVFVAELQRAKRAGGAPWVRNFGKTIKAGKSGSHVTVRASERPSVQTVGEGSHRTIAA